MKTEVCPFSGYKIYPGRGKIVVRLDGRSFRLLNSKTESHFLAKKNPRNFHWTVFFRRQRRKGISEEVQKKKTRKTIKPQKAIVGASIELIKERQQAHKTSDDQEAIEKAKQKRREEAKKRREELKKSVMQPRAAAAPKIVPKGGR